LRMTEKTSVGCVAGRRLVRNAPGRSGWGLTQPRAGKASNVGGFGRKWGQMTRGTASTVWINQVGLPGAAAQYPLQRP
jgi:hypothetical protein